MKTLLALLLSLSASWGITNVTLPYIVDTASIPKVKYVDKNDSALKWGVNNLGDTVNAASGSGILVRQTGATLAGPTISAPTLSGTAAMASGTYSGTLGVTGVATFTAQPIFSSLTASLPVFTDGSKGPVSNAMTGTGSVMMSASPTTTGTLTGAAANFSGGVSTGALSSSTGAFSSTLGVTGLFTGTTGSFSGTLAATGKITGSDTVAALLGFRAGNTAVSNVSLYRSGADMWTTPDSLTVGGKISVSDSILGAAARFSGGYTSQSGSFVEYANAGGTANLRVGNTSTSASSDARLNLQVNGATAGDPFIRYDVTGVTSWATGADNSVSGDPYVIAASGTLGSSNAVSITTAGNVTVTGSITADSLVSSKFYEENTFTGTLGGCASGGTGTFSYVRIGKHVTLMLPSSITCTSNSTSGLISGVPASITPSRSIAITPSYSILDNGTSTTATAAYLSEYIAVLTTSNTIQLYKNGSTTFTNSGLKGLRTVSVPGTPAAATFAYTLQ